MRRAWVAGALLAVLPLGGCGVRAQGEPDRLPPSVLPTEPDVPRPVVAPVYFVRDGRLVPARVLVGAPGTPAQRLAALAAGVDDPALRTYLDPASPPRVSVADGVAVVSLAASFARAPREARLLAAGQVVFTLTESRDVAVVRFRAGGRDMPVPRPDGTAAPGPVTRADYATLAA